MRDPELRRITPLVVAAFLAVVAGGALDLLLDAPGSWVAPHVLVELLLIGLCLGLAVHLWRGRRSAPGARDRSREELGRRGAGRDAWRERAGRLLGDLGAAMDEQFREWELTPAEREVALLLIKGYSHRQIARSTGLSEEVSREHASSVYGKAGLSGRAELAAFFLEDVTLPGDRPAPGDPDGDPT